jgi:hypothetical protein
MRHLSSHANSLICSLHQLLTTASHVQVSGTSIPLP